MKIVVDMNLTPRWVVLLNGAGFAATHWSKVGAATASDEEIMAWALSEDAAVLTQDLDFSAILAYTRNSKPSVIQVRADDLNPDRIGVHVVSAINQTKNELKAGAIVSVDPANARLRLLPL